MKRFIVSIGVVALFATAAQAQEIPDRKHGREDMMIRHHRSEGLEQLNLSEEQKEKVKSLREETRKQMEEMKKDDNMTVKDWRAKREAIRKDHREKIQSLLTTDQKAQLEKSRADRRIQTEERAKARFEKMKQDLKLSDDQSAKLKSSRDQLRQKMQALRENQSLSDEAKKEQMKELMKQRKENLRSILTEEQWKKLQEQHQKRDPKRKKV